MRTKLGNCSLFALWLLAWHFIYSLGHLYESERLSEGKEAMLEEMNATGLAALCLMVLAVSFKITMITLPFLLLFWTINTFAILASRLLVRRALAQVRKHGRNLRCIVILGTNTRALEFARRLRAKPERGYRNLGFIDEPCHRLKECRRTGQTLLCSFSCLAEILRNTIVDE